MNRLQEILNNLRRNTTYTLINALGSYTMHKLKLRLVFSKELKFLYFLRFSYENLFGKNHLRCHLGAKRF